MMKRVVGSVLFGTGLFLVVVAVALAFVVTPRVSKMPLDLEPPETVLSGPNATFVQAKRTGDNLEIAVQHGDLTAINGIKPDVEEAAKLTGDLADKTVVWTVYQAIKRSDNDELINASQSRIAMDRESGAAVDWDGQCYTDGDGEPCESGSISYDGQLYAFPFGTEKKTYQYFDSTLKRPLPIHYQATEKVEGLTVYKFVQEVPEQQVDMDAELVHGLLGVFAPTATDGVVRYRTTRTLWVEPVTGSVVDYQDAQHRELVADTGERTVLIDAVFRYTPETRATIVDKASDGRSMLMALSRYVPIVLAVLGLGLLVLGYLVARSGRAPAREPVTEVAPRHASSPA
jgi:hypothetical protein